MAVIKKTIEGHLGNDSTVRTFKNGKGDLISFNVAAQNEGPGVTWYSCAVFDDKLKALSKNLKKGNKVRVSGSFEEKEFNGKMFNNLKVETLDTPEVLGQEDAVKQEFIKAHRIENFDIKDCPF